MEEQSVESQAEFDQLEHEILGYVGNKAKLDELWAQLDFNGNGP